jgi:hypothetical protein
MLERFCTSLRVGIARDGLTLLQCKSGSSAAVKVLAELALAPEDATSPALMAKQLQQLFTMAPATRMPITVVLADDWVRLWQVTPPMKTVRLSDLEAAATLRFQTLFGEIASDWSITADWDTQVPFFAAAIPRWLLLAIETETLARKLTLLAVAPQFLMAWNRWCTKLTVGAWFVMVHDGLLTLGAASGSRLAAICSAPLPSTHDSTWLATYVRREALRLNCAVPGTLMVCGDLLGTAANAAGDLDLRCIRLDPLWHKATPYHAGVALALTGALR